MGRRWLRRARRPPMPTPDAGAAAREAQVLAEHFDSVCQEHGSISTAYVARKIADFAESFAAARVAGERERVLAAHQEIIARSLGWLDHRAAHSEICGPCRVEAKMAQEYGFGSEHLEHCYIVQARDDAAALAAALRATPGGAG